jgi:phenylacetate-CoA ligase
MLRAATFGFHFASSKRDRDNIHNAMLKKALIKYLINPVFWKLIRGSKRYDLFNELSEKQWRSIEQNREEQASKLFDIIEHAHRHVPYYRRIIEDKKISYARETIFEDIKALPILSQDDLRDSFKELTSTDGEYASRKPFVDTSGGSTGEPKRFIQDKQAAMRLSAGMDWFYSWAGRDLGDYSIKLWADVNEAMQGRKTFTKKATEFVTNIEIVNSFNMSVANMRRYVETINRKKPAVIIAYVQCIYELAAFIKNHGLDVHRPRGIVTGAGTLYPGMKSLIEDVFGCRTFNIYGAREATSMACNCEKQEGLHLNVFSYFFEILDSDLNRVGPGETGKVYITTLDNYSMPLVRYDIGDFATRAESETCSCGRGLPLIKHVEGREMSVFKTREGKVVPAEFFIHFIGVVFNEGYISKFQVIQEDYDRIRIKLVLVDREKFEARKGEIVEAVKKVMGHGCSVEFEFVEDIEPSRSGKFLYTVSEIR